jgi:hypothetical protein
VYVNVVSMISATDDGSGNVTLLGVSSTSDGGGNVTVA